MLAECQEVISLDVPAPLEAFGMHLERMALHYPESRLTAAERAVVVRDWRRLMGDTPADILSQAVDDYIMSPARFFPTPGQFSEIVDPMVRWRKALARRARETLELMRV